MLYRVQECDLEVIESFFRGPIECYEKTFTLHKRERHVIVVLRSIAISTYPLDFDEEYQPSCLIGGFSVKVINIGIDRFS